MCRSLISVAWDGRLYDCDFNQAMDLPLLPGLRGVPGRLQAVRAGQPFRVIVDYAHTPEAFSRVLPLARAMTPGKLIAVFGSAGERDTAKRPLQGEIACRHCDLLVLADEDPRGEDPQAIRATGRVRVGAPMISRDAQVTWEKIVE